MSNSQNPRMAAAVKTLTGDEQSTSFTPQQLEQLLNLLPQLQTAQTSQADNENDFDHFSGMITCLQANCNSHDWIVDSGSHDLTTI